MDRTINHSARHFGGTLSILLDVFFVAHFHTMLNAAITRLSRAWHCYTQSLSKL
jgi:hypothetical protein